MARYQGSTADRGLGAAHVADKKRLLAELARNPGQPCWRCGEPMWPWQALDRGHIIDRALGGADGPALLEHAACNRAAGARLGNRLRNVTGRIAPPRAPNAYCATCGQAYHYPPRQCGMCGNPHYHPTRRVQFTCSRQCGQAYKKAMARAAR